MLDPFMGSGSTGVAALALGRSFIGFESVEEYLDVAARRLGEVVPAEGPVTTYAANVPVTTARLLEQSGTRLQEPMSYVPTKYKEWRRVGADGSARAGAGKYKYVRGKKVGTRFGVTGHIIDTYAEDQRGRVHLISLKWQQVSGTAEQKVPFEVISLIDLLLKNESYYKAHLVLGGDGWKYKDFYVSVAACSPTFATPRA